MNYLAMLLIIISGLLNGCAKNDVPDVNPKNIVVNGKQMAAQQFLDKYCVGNASNNTCAEVNKAMLQNSTRSADGVPRF